jgi:hypothetical protein
MRLARITFLAASVLALSASPAAAKKDKPDLGKLETGTATVTSPTTGTFTAIAQCPKGTKVVGGGFVFTAPATTQDFLNPLESRREGKKAWRVSAYRIDNAGNGPAFTLTAEAYCRSGLGKLSERTETQVSVGNATTGNPIATCPVGKSALGGGFSLTGPAQANFFHSHLTANLMNGGVDWETLALNLTPGLGAVTYTSYVYCQRKGEKAPRVVTGVGAIPAAQFSNGVADTASCSGKRDALAGGFQLPQFFSPGNPIALITESRHVGKGWHIAANHLAGTGTHAMAAYGYCS